METVEKISDRLERKFNFEKLKPIDRSILSLVKNANKETMEENSNKNAVVVSTQRDLIAGECSKDISDRLLLPKEIVDAHNNGVLHFHDKDYFIQSMHNCCLVNIGDMLDNGTVMNGKMIESPKSFQVACIVMTQIIASVASNQYGGQSLNICHLGKYLRRTYEKAYKKRFLVYSERGLSKEECHERAAEDAIERRQEDLESGVQTIQYQINTLMTTNGQTPFVTLFMYLDKEDEYIEENAMIIEEILKQRLRGIKNEKGVYITPAFPKLIYVLDENNCLKGGKYDYLTKLAVKCSSKRLYPDYISAKIMRQNYEGNVFSPMGCRSFLSPWKNEKGEYIFESRFNQGVVSINLPQIGIIAKGNEEIFWKLLDERLLLCKKALMCRHNALLGTLSDASPIHWQYGAIARLKKGETIDKLLNSCFSTISLGYIGLYELTKLMKGVSHTSKEGEDFSVRVMKYLKDTVDKWKTETGLGFALYGTPAESLCYRFAKIDKEKFGDIKDVTDKGYYTNSYHVDVREKINAFDKLKFESKYQNISSGGAISYVEIPNMKNNLEALEEIVKFIYDNIQYAEFNTKSDYCQVCGFDGEIIINDENEWECPQCGNKDHSKMNVTRRTCGYLGENFWNVGKTKEIKARVLHI
ncbi:MAG TPA: anaerobic ribonucleoside-triphosphate reductase [Candidatus Scatovivens faecipullorum]|nr:anaerobic ribonucleoside-triphosphate reductase [Candidatus Scatovivens faecipullorum]